MVLSEQWMWKTVNGELKMQKAEVKGYIIDFFDGLRLSSEWDKHMKCYKMQDQFLTGLTEQSGSERRA